MGTRRGSAAENCGISRAIAAALAGIERIAQNRAVSIIKRA